MGIMRDIKEFFNPKAKEARLKHEAKIKAQREEERQKAETAEKERIEQDCDRANAEKTEKSKSDMIEKALGGKENVSLAIHSFINGTDISYETFKRDQKSPFPATTIKNTEHFKHYETLEKVAECIKTQSEQKPTEFQNAFLGFVSTCYRHDNSSKHQTIMKEFLRNGADPATTYDKDGNTVLGACIWRDNPTMARLMVGSDQFDPSKQDAFTLFELCYHHSNGKEQKELAKDFIRKGLGKEYIKESENEGTTVSLYPKNRREDISPSDISAVNNFVADLYNEIKKEPEVEAMRKKEEQRRTAKEQLREKQNDPARKRLVDTLKTLRSIGKKETAQEIRKNITTEQMNALRDKNLR